MAVSTVRFQQLALEGPRHVVVAEGDLDVGAASQLAAALDHPIESGKTHVVLDLSDVDFVDSMAIHILVGAARELRQRFGRLVLVSRAPAVRRLIQLTAVDRVAPVFNTREAALRGLLDA
jgi:stage II sporulation protein AA (anti-sigma F factor antagonist)